MDTIGHNSGLTLTDLLTEETVVLKGRADALVDSANRATVTDGETAEKATVLAKMLGEHSKEIETARKIRKQPFLDGCTTVDSHFGAIKTPVDTARTAVILLIDQYRREQEQKAAEERRRVEEEARKAREAELRAEAARVAAEQARLRAEEEARLAIERARQAEEAAKAAGDREAAEKAARERAEAQAREARERQAASARALEAEIARNAAAAKAETIEVKAASIEFGPIDTGLGVKAHGRRKPIGRIIDLKAALKHALKIDEPTIRAAVQSVLDRQVKAKVPTFPGCEIVEESTTVIR